PAEAILRGLSLIVPGDQSSDGDGRPWGFISGGQAPEERGRSIESLSAQKPFRGLARFPTEIVHGTTVATNALLERKGGGNRLVTTEGFEDVIGMGRQARPQIYNLLVTRPAPLVRRDLRFGIAERTGPDGTVIKPLGAAEVDKLSERIGKLGAES